MKEDKSKDESGRDESVSAMEFLEDTQAKKKLWSYFLEVSSTDWFENKILELRKKYRVPEKGFTEGSRILPPEQLYDRWNASGEIRDEIEKICNKYSLHYLDWFSEIEYYLFYNEFFNVYEPNSKDLIYLADLAEERVDPFEESTQIEDIKHFPVALRISPYATERDILDFVKKMYKPLISPSLKRYQKPGVKIGKVKSKDEKITKRNKFIYEHKDLPRKEIMRLVHKEFGEVLDYGHIGKIISLEKTKRKDMST